MRALQAIADAICTAGVACTLNLSDDPQMTDDQIDLTDFPGAYVQICGGRTGLMFGPAFFKDGPDAFMVDGPLTPDPVAAARLARQLHRDNA